MKNTSLKTTRPITTRPKITLGLLATLMLLCSCSPKEQTLEVPDLTAGERLYFDRVVAVERAKSVALVDRPSGLALLDSLDTAWGDSAQVDVLKGLPQDPNRAIAVAKLLSLVIAAEHDSLMWAPNLNRLQLPLPDLKRPGRQPRSTLADNPEPKIPQPTD